jgi:hypothetical protein
MESGRFSPESPADIADLRMPPLASTHEIGSPHDKARIACASRCSLDLASTSGYRFVVQRYRKIGAAHGKA